MEKAKKKLRFIEFKNIAIVGKILLKCLSTHKANIAWLGAQKFDSLKTWFAPNTEQGLNTPFLKNNE